MGGINPIFTLGSFRNYIPRSGNLTGQNSPTGRMATRRPKPPDLADPRAQAKIEALRAEFEECKGQLHLTQMKLDQEREQNSAAAKMVEKMDGALKEALEGKLPSGVTQPYQVTIVRNEWVVDKLNKANATIRALNERVSTLAELTKSLERGKADLRRTLTQQAAELSHALRSGHGQSGSLQREQLDELITLRAEVTALKSEKGFAERRATKALEELLEARRQLVESERLRADSETERANILKEIANVNAEAMLRLANTIVNNNREDIR